VVSEPYIGPQYRVPKDQQRSGDPETIYNYNPPYKKDPIVVDSQTLFTSTDDSELGTVEFDCFLLEASLSLGGWDDGALFPAKVYMYIQRGNTVIFLRLLYCTTPGQVAVTSKPMITLKPGDTMWLSGAYAVSDPTSPGVYAHATFILQPYI